MRFGLKLCWLGAGLVPTLMSVAAPAATLREELPFVHLTPEDRVTPLPAASVQKIFQEKDGQRFIWFAFYAGGVARYDGQRLEQYGTDDGLTNPTVRELLVDGDGRLWIGSDSGLVVSQRPLAEYPAGERIRFVSSLHGQLLVSTRIQRNCLVADAEGGVWVGTSQQGLHRYRITPGGALRHRVVSTTVGGDRNLMVEALLSSRDGSLWVALAGRLAVLRPSAELLQVVAHLDDPPRALYQGRSGAVWGGSAGGSVWQINEQADGVTITIIADGALQEEVSSILETAEGTVWISSIGDGLLRLAPGPERTAVHYTRRHGLISDTVWHITSDIEDNLWFAQNGGVSRLRHDHQAFGQITAQSRDGAAPSLPDSAVFCVLPPSESPLPGVLWIGTGGGLAAIAPSGATTTLRSEDGLASSSIYALDRDFQDRVWLATPSGLSVLAIERPPPPSLAGSTVQPVTLFTRTAQIWTSPIHTLYSCRRLVLADTGNPAMVVTGIGGVWLQTGERWFHCSTESGLRAAAATSADLDVDGRLWVSTVDAGIFRSQARFSPEVLELLLGEGDRRVRSQLFTQAWSSQLGAPSDSVHFLRWHQGKLFAATAAGLAVLRLPTSDDPGAPEVVVETILDRSNGLGGSMVRGFTPAADTSHLWVAQNEGLAELDPASSTVLRTISKHEGLLDNEAWSYSPVAVDANSGTVYLGTPKGVSIYRPHLDRINTVAPSPVLRNLKVKEDRLGHNEVTLEYAALSFGNETKVRFRTRLLGYDTEWSGPTEESRIRYTNLPAFLREATYVFEVLACNEDGVWTEQPLRIELQVRPAWWLTGWAGLAYCAAFVALLVSFTHLRSRRLRRRTVELQEQVRARTAELESKARELMTLEKIVRNINQKVSLEKLLETILEQGLTLFPQADKAICVTYDAERDIFQATATAGWQPGTFDDFTLSHSEALRRYSEAGEKVREGVFIIRDFEDLPGTDRFPDLPTPRSMLTMSVMLDEAVEGFLVFDSYSDAEAFTRADLQRLDLYRQHAISAILKARMMVQLKEKTREALQANQSKSAFLAAVSHELRTPLNSIIGFSEVLRIRAADLLPPTFRHFLDNIHGSGEHLLGIINDILDLSKIEAGHMVLSPEPVCLAAIIDGVCTIMKGITSKRGITLQVELPPELPPLLADGPRLKQILYNLLSNAVKFSPDGASVVTRVRPLTAEESGLEQQAVELSIIDHGCGIAADHLNRVFEEFVQVEGDAPRRAQGTGLGLALVKRLVQMHGGTVSVSSEVGRGSTFSVVLPAADEPAAAPPDDPGSGIDHRPPPSWPVS